MSVVKIAYGCCVGSWDKLQRNVIPRIGGRPLIALSGQTRIANAYNAILEYARYANVGMLILLHDDLEITDPAAEAKFTTALTDPDVALVGVAGGSGQHGLDWWNYAPVGHQRTDVLNIDFGCRDGDVDLLEGSILVFGRWAIDHLRFDYRFPGFHGYDEIARQAIDSYGRRVVVADVDTHHHTSMGFKSDDSHAEWNTANQIYLEKWEL